MAQTAKKKDKFYIPPGETRDGWENLIDEFWETSTERKNLENQQAELRNRLNSGVYYNDIPKDSAVVLIGKEHTVQVSKEREARSFKNNDSIKAIHKILGNKFYEIIAVKMADLEIMLSEEDLKKHTIKTYTGVRSYTPVKE